MTNEMVWLTGPNCVYAICPVDFRIGHKVAMEYGCLFLGQFTNAMRQYSGYCVYVALVFL